MSKRGNHALGPTALKEAMKEAEEQIDQLDQPQKHAIGSKLYSRYGKLYSSNGVLYVGGTNVGVWWRMDLELDPKPETRPIVYPEYFSSASSTKGMYDRITTDIRHSYASPAGILMHRMSWHLLVQDRPDFGEGADQITVAGDGRTGYLMGVPVRTTWDMPEWEYVLAWPVKQPATKIPRDDMKLARQLYEDAKSNKIKARGLK